MQLYDVYIGMIILCKILMLICAVIHYILNSTHSTLKEWTGYYKDVFEFLFVFMLSILLLYLFNPINPKTINRETRILLFMLGIILLITAKYSIFIGDIESARNLELLQKIFH